jgi:large repetitive protein
VVHNSDGTTILTWNYYEALDAGNGRMIRLGARFDGTVIGTVRNKVSTTASTPARTNVSSSSWADVKCVGPEIEVTKTSDAGEASPGAIVKFPIIVENKGDVDFDGVKVIDLMPVGMSYYAGETHPLASDVISNLNGTTTIIWEIGPLAAGGQSSVTLAAQITATDDLVNNAKGIGRSKWTPVIDSDNTTVRSLAPGIDVTKSSTPSRGAAGTRISFTIGVDNTGEVDLMPVRVVDLLPEGLSYSLEGTSIVPSAVQSNPNGTTTITWNDIGPIRPGGSSQVILASTVDSMAEGTLTNLVNATGKPPKGDTVSDSARAEVLATPAGISIDKRSDAFNYTKGSLINFTLSINNTGVVRLSPVETIDTLPDGLVYVSSYPLARVDGQEVAWTLDGLDPRESATLNLTDEVDDQVAGMLKNVAVALGRPPTGSNVTDSDEADVNILLSKIKVVKSADKGAVKRGEEIVYTISIKNVGSIPAEDVVVKDVFDSTVELISASPEPSGDGVWYFEKINPREWKNITLRVRVPTYEVNFEMEQKVAGEGYVNVANDYSTEKQPYIIRNMVLAVAEDTKEVSANASVLVSGEAGTALSTREHGSGEYTTSEVNEYSSRYTYLESEKSLEAIYKPTTFSLPMNRSTAFDSKWTEAVGAKNHITGASMTEAIRHAERIERVSRLELDENGSRLQSETSFQGMASMGYLKKPVPNASAKIRPAYESREDYLGSFKVKEAFDEYGKNVVSEREVEGVGFVASDKRIGQSQRTHESGTGYYKASEKVATHTNYIYKDLSAAHLPTNYSLTPNVDLNSSIKWSEGIWSKSSGTVMRGGDLVGACKTGTCKAGTVASCGCANSTPISFIGREISGADYINETTAARGLSDMKTDVSFSGTARFREILKDGSSGIGGGKGRVPEVETDDIYSGKFNVTRRAELTGTSRYSVPHISVSKKGIARYGWVRDVRSNILEYTIEVINDGSTALGPIYVRDLFPGGTQFINASVRPSQLTPEYANWTLVYLPVGGCSKIELNLNLTDKSEDIVNRVEVAGGYDGLFVFASNFSTIEKNWLPCCQPEVFVKKTASIDPANPSIVNFRIVLQNTVSFPVAARVTDRMPPGLKFLESSVAPDLYSNRAVWNIAELMPEETWVIDYTVEALRDGAFTNTAYVEVQGTRGEGRASASDSATVVVGGSGIYSGSGWKPPRWGFNTSEDGLTM